jgi:hypothetical protein
MCVYEHVLLFVCLFLQYWSIFVLKLVILSSLLLFKKKTKLKVELKILFFERNFYYN